MNYRQECGINFSAGDKYDSLSSIGIFTKNVITLYAAVIALNTNF